MRSLEAILIHQGYPLAVDMAGTGFQRTLKHIDTMQFIAHQILIDRLLADNIGIFQAFVSHLEVVVGNDHFPLAHQLPVEALRRAIETIETVLGEQAVGSCSRSVIPNFRRTQDTPGSRIIYPCPADSGTLVDRLTD